MSQSTEPFFIVSSGRSGTAMLHKALSNTGCVDMQHEYAVQIIQPLAVKKYLSLCGPDEIRARLRETYGAAVHYSKKPFWGDSSNKASWLIPELAALLPRAKFVHLVRDGRKVSGSYFRKLGEECYDNASNAVMQAYYDAPDIHPAPPPEKKYWWPLPRRGDRAASAFRAYDQFGRIAWHWAEVNRVILEAMATLDPTRCHFVRLEDLRANPDALKALYRFLNLPYSDEYFPLFARPHNVNRPEDKLLDARERAAFQAIAGTMMEELGYAGRAEYVVNY